MPARAELADAARKRAALLDATTAPTVAQTREMIQHAEPDAQLVTLQASQEQVLLDMVDAAEQVPRHEQKWHLAVTGDTLDGPWGSRAVLDDDIHALDRAGFLRAKQYNYVYGNDYVISATGYDYARALREKSASQGEPTGWPAVDAGTAKLREQLRAAADAQDFNAVGLLCVSVLGAVGRAVFDAERDLPPGADVPHPDDARTRVELFLDSVAPGAQFSHIRGLIRSAWGQSQAVKHRRDPDRAEAAVAADAVILIASIARRLYDRAGRSSS